MDNFIRKCKQCNNDILYKTKYQYNDAMKKDRLCKSCACKNNADKQRIIYTGSLTKKCNVCDIEHTFSNYGKYKRAKLDCEYLCKLCATSKVHSGKKLSEEHIRKISESTKQGWKDGKYEKAVEKSSERWSGENNPMYKSNRTGSLNPFYKKHHSEETIQHLKEISKKKNLSPETLIKRSNSAKKRVERTGMPSVNYNPEACKIIDEYGIQNGYNFQHALNGGEYKIKINNKHYFLDGYDLENNVVIEYYEKHHKWNKEQDKKRKQEIIDKLNCKFIELKEWEIYD
ncbi:MAG: hypothetical protein H8D94_01040 [Candidatus Pelagibacter sp.]|nr:hypothetical protein [Candidatus Pelagibacter sp.]